MKDKMALDKTLYININGETHLSYKFANFHDKTTIERKIVEALRCFQGIKQVKRLEQN